MQTNFVCQYNVTSKWRTWRWDFSVLCSFHLPQKQCTCTVAYAMVRGSSVPFSLSLSAVSTGQVFLLQNVIFPNELLWKYATSWHKKQANTPVGSVGSVGSVKGFLLPFGLKRFLSKMHFCLSIHVPADLWRTSVYSVVWQPWFCYLYHPYYSMSQE